MSDRLEVVITGKDGISRVFKEVTTGANATGVAVESAGKKGASGLREMAKAALENKKATDDLKIGGAALAATFTLMSRSALDQTRSVEGIKRAYGDSADEILDFTESLQDAGIASNDAARDAASTASTLTQSYGFTSDAIEQLISRSADLAKVKGMDLADAVERTSAAMRGEGESAEALGLTLSDSALATAAAAAGLDGWNTTMSESEKAAFRFQVFLEQSAYAQGAAADAADTTAGKVRTLINEVQDAGQSFAAWTGPVGESVAVLSDFAIQGGLAVGGIAKLGSGLKELEAGAKAAQVGSAALNVAMGPAGLVAAAGLAGLAIYELVTRFDDANLSAKEAEGQIKSFDETLAGLGKQGTGESTLAGLGEQRQVLIDLALASQEASDKVAFAWADAAAAQTAYQEAAINNRDAATQQALLAAADAAREYAESLDGVILTEQQMADLAADFVDIYTDMNPLNADLVTARLAELKAQLDTNVITADQFVVAVDELNASSDSYGLTIEEIVAGERNRANATGESTKATAASAETIKTLESAIGDLSAVKLSPDLLKDIETVTTMGGSEAKAALQSYFDQFKKTGDMATFEKRVDGIADVLELQAAATHRLATAEEREYLAFSKSTIARGVELGQRKRTNDAIFETASALDIFGTGQAIAAEKQGVFNTRLAGIHAPALQAIADMYDAEDAAKGYARALVGTISLAANLRPLDISVRGGDKVTGTAAEVQQAGAAMTSVLGIFQQIDNLGKGHEQAGSIVESLVGKPGEWGKIDDLYNGALVSHKRYLMTVEAGNNILARSDEIERDLNVTRAKQLPLLDAADARYAELVDNISHMSAEQATATIGFMDANESMKAQNALALAAAAANTEVGSTARQAAQASIEGAIAADPVLEQMLTQIGLVSRDHKGNLVINFDNADALNKSTDDLTEAINNLTLAIQNIPPSANTNVTVNGTDTAVGQVGEVQTALDGLHDKTINVTTVTSILDLGKTGTQGGAQVGNDWRGGVPGFAMGGMVTARVAEVDPELVTFAGGGAAIARRNGLYDLPANSYVHNAPQTRQMLEGIGGGMTVQLINYGDINGAGGLDEIVAELERLVRARLTGLGAK